jgi:hypothetical protein
MTSEHSEGLSMKTIEDVLTHLRAEYLEMPGLRLKAQQVQRLCGIEQAMCQHVLDSLVAEGFLCAKSDGHYARLTGWSSSTSGTGHRQTGHTIHRSSCEPAATCRLTDVKESETIVSVRRWQRG